LKNSKKILIFSLKRNKYPLLGILFIILIALISIFILPKLYINSSLGPQYEETGGIGDTINGISAPFIAIAASILTFLAFWVQFRSNQEQKKQFAKQNQDQLFFKLLEKQESRIVNSSFISGGEKCSSYQLLETIALNLKNKIQVNHLPDLARDLIINQPTLLDNAQMLKIFNLSPSFPITSNRFETIEEDRLIFVNKMASMKLADRYEYIKHYFGSPNRESSAQKGILIEIGSVNFYSIDFHKRELIYQNAFNEIEQIYGSFLDGYIRGWEFIVQFIDESNSKLSYTKFLISQTSKYELIILFYYLASGYANEVLWQFIKEHTIFKNLHYYNKDLIDLPTEEILSSEINYMLSQYAMSYNNKEFSF
jgi:hypothetical protein